MRKTINDEIFELSPEDKKTYAMTFIAMRYFGKDLQTIKTVEMVTDALIATDDYKRQTMNQFKKLHYLKLRTERKNETER
jgi:hypothetical protein